MTDLKIADAFTVYSNSRSAIIQMWTFYSLVTLGILGFTVGSEKVIPRASSEIAVIIAGYVAFAIGNAWAVITSQRELMRVAEGIKVLMANDVNLKYFSVDPIAPRAIVVFYVVMTVVVSSAVAIRLDSPPPLAATSHPVSCACTVGGR